MLSRATVIFQFAFFNFQFSISAVCSLPAGELRPFPQGQNEANYD